MIHRLTVGHIDAAEVAMRRLRIVAPLPDEAFVLVERVKDPDSPTDAPMFQGQRVTCTKDYIECYWYLGAPNGRSVEFALAAIELGLTVADVAHGRVVSGEELRDSIKERPSMR